MIMVVLYQVLLFVSTLTTPLIPLIDLNAGDETSDHSTPIEVVDSLFCSNRPRLVKSDSANNVLLNSAKVGLVSTVSLLGVEGAAGTTSETELAGSSIKNTNVFDPRLLAPTASTSDLTSSFKEEAREGRRDGAGASGKTHLESMNWKDFSRVAELDPDLYRCFGTPSLPPFSFTLFSTLLSSPSFPLR